MKLNEWHKIGRIMDDFRMFIAEFRRDNEQTKVGLDDVCEEGVCEDPYLIAENEKIATYLKLKNKIERFHKATETQITFINDYLNRKYS
jgi:hypothetical protein